MNKIAQLPSGFAWLNGRETQRESLAYGEVVVPLINIRERYGSLPECGSTVAELAHGTRIHVLEGIRHKEEERSFYRISANGIDGWVPESFIAWKWSCFTFLGTLHPAQACRELDVSVDFGGMNLVIMQNRFAVMVEGDPDHFNSIRFAVSNFVNRITSAQAPLSATPLRAELTNWVEVPSDLSEGQRMVGFMALEEEQPLSVSNEDIENAQSIVPLMALVPYLDLALSDFFQALNFPQHALIFLARAIESIENHFGRIAKQTKGKGKETVMQELLGVEKSDVDYVMKRANESHRRHATRDGTPKALPQDELIECFKKTANIIAAFATFLENAGL
jgi:hypothetical protein